MTKKENKENETLEVKADETKAEGLSDAENTPKENIDRQADVLDEQEKADKECGKQKCCGESQCEKEQENTTCETETCCKTECSVKTDCMVERFKNWWGKAKFEERLLTVVAGLCTFYVAMSVVWGVFAYLFCSNNTVYKFSDRNQEIVMVSDNDRTKLIKHDIVYDKGEKYLRIVVKTANR